MVVLILANYYFINVELRKVTTDDEKKGASGVLSPILISVFNQLNTVDLTTIFTWNIEQRFFGINFESFLVPPQNKIGAIIFTVDYQ
jgi:hypothetical protein